MLGYSAEELNHIHIKNITHPEDVFAAQTERNRLLRGEISSYQLEVRFITKSGETIWVNVVSAAFKDPHQKLLFELCMLENITNRKTSEERLKRMANELSNSNAKLDRFTAIASHDLRSPLNTIRNFSQLLEKELDKEANKNALEYLGYIQSSAERMKLLIDDLLEYSRMKASRKNTWIDLSTILEEVVTNLKAEIDESGAKINWTNLPSLPCDGTQISRLFQNLINNAIKYRGESAPTIEISVQEKESEWLFTVSDNGIGIDMLFSEEIFQPFRRLATTDKIPGSGLGLAICRSVVEGHGGKIHFTSKPGKGTTFYFTLPKTCRTPFKEKPSFEPVLVEREPERLKPLSDSLI
jgi:PAS domain S-box-containing protein